MSQNTSLEQASRLLILEADRSIHRKLTDVLSCARDEVIVCSTAGEALEHLSNPDFGVAIIDPHPPDLGGTDWLKRIHQLNNNIKVIIHTAQGSYESARDAVNLGAFAYVEKQSDLSELVVHVNRAFNTCMSDFSEKSETPVTDRAAEPGRSVASGKQDECNLKQLIEERTAELRESEARYSDLYNQAPDMYVSVDAKTAMVLECNDTLATNLRFPKSDVVGKPVFDLYHPDCITDAKAAFQSFVETGRVHDAELQLKRRDGTPIDVSLAVSSVRDDDGNILYSRSCWRDITARKRAETELQESEGRMRALLEGAFEGIVISGQGKVLEFNPAFADMFGYTSAEMQHLSAVDLVTPESGTIVTQQIASGAENPYEVVGLRKDGTTFDLELLGKNCKYHGRTARITAMRDITERKQAEDKLAASEQLFRTTFESASIPMTLNSITGQFIETNDAFQELFGYSQEELEQLTFKDITHAEDIDKGWALFKQLVAGQAESIQLEKRYHRKDGSVILAQTSASAIRDSDGTFRNVVGMVQDITASRRAEEAVARGKNRLRDILDSLFGFVGVYSLDGTLVEANRAPLEAAGLTRDDVIGKPFWDTYWWSYSKDVQDQLRQALARAAAGDTVRYDAQVRVSDDHLIDIDVTFGPLRDASGEVVELIGFAVDITGRKEAERALTENEERLRQIAETINDVFWIIDWKSHEVLFASPAYERVWGRSLQELYTNPKFNADSVHPDDRTRVREKFVHLGEGGSYEEDYRILRPDGSVRWIHDQGSAVRDANGQVYRVAGLARDITDRKRVEDQLRKMNIALANAMPGIARLDTEGQYCEVNDLYASMMGFRPDEMIGNSWEPTVHINDHSVAVQAYEQMLLEGKGEFEAKGIRKDGTTFFKHALMVKIVDEEDNATGHHCFMRDITDRKEIEAKNLEYTAMLKTLTSIQGEFLSGTDPRESFNRILTLLLNVTGSEYGFIGRVLHTDDGAPYLKTYAITDIAWNDEMRATYEQGTHDGMEFHNLDTLFGAVLTTAATVLSNEAETDPRSGGLPPGHPPLRAFIGLPLTTGGEFIGMFGLANRAGGYDADLVEMLQPVQAACANRLLAFRHEQERERIESHRQQLAAAVASTAEAVVITDTKAVIQYVNTAFTKMSGYSAEEVLGKTPRVFNSGKYPPEFYKEMWDVILRGEVWAGELTNGRKDGTTYETRLTIASVKDDHGEVTGFVSVQHDITDRPLAEKRQQLLVRELDHRVKNCLAAACAMAKLTAGSSDTPKEFAEKFESRLVAMARVHDMLARKSWDSVSLARLVELVLDPYVGMGHVDCSGPTVQIDATRAQPLALALHELATNAAKYGSLLNHDGVVEVKWHNSDRQTIIIDWLERNGSHVTQPDELGLGLQLVTGFVEGELGGHFEMAFNPEGISCKLELPESTQEKEACEQIVRN